MTKDDLYNRIIKEYMKCGSVKQTAINAGTTLVRAQRVLITEGLWRSDTSDAVCELYEQGKTTQEIADALYISVKTVQAYLPYSKGFYSSSMKSSEAVRSNLYRNRKMFAADKQVNHAVKDFVEKKKDNASPVHDRTRKNKYSVMKLRLELIMDKKDWNLMLVLRDYSRVKKGIVREILVPSDISLHKLNYAIQRSFGWQNSHLHQFILPSKVFAELTDGKYVVEEDELFYAQNGSFMKWAEYCGTYFRFPTDDMNDLYWDDDYNGELSIKSWLKRKYNGYNDYKGYSEHFVIAKKEVESFIDEFPFLNVDTYFSEPKTQRGKRGNIIRKPISEATVAEAGLQIGELGSLLERLPLNEVLRAKGDKKTTKSLLATMMKERNKLYESCCDKYVDMNKGITSSRFGLPWSEDNVPVLPITDEIFYQYDFGDGWGVKITCVEQYYTKDKLDDAGDQFVAVSLDDQAWLDETRVYNHKDEQINGEERELIVKAGLLRKLTCTYADGLSVFDDVGGIYGFADFLIELHEGESEDRESCKVWASSLGWTGREIKPKSML